MDNKMNNNPTNKSDMDYLRLNPINLMRQLAFRMVEHDVTALAAQMTYFLVLAVFPFLMVLLNLAALTGLSNTSLLGNISDFMPGESGQMVLNVIGETVTASTTALFSVSMLAALWSSSNGINALIKGFNKAYDLRESRPFWKVRGLAILFTLGLIGIIIIVFVMLVMGKVIGEQIFDNFNAASVFSVLWTLLRFIIPLGSMIVMFVLFYRFAPDTSISTRKSLIGAVFTTLIWISISQLFSTYINRFGNYAKVYGSIGGIIIFLIWLYLSSIIILTGNEIIVSIAYLQSDERIAKYENVPSLLPTRRKNS